MKPFHAIPSLVLDPILPVPLVILIGVILVALTVAAYLQVGSRVGAWRNGVLGGFRLLGILAVVLILLQPSHLEQIPPPEKPRLILLALDTSRSMEQMDVDKASRLD